MELEDRIYAACEGRDTDKIPTLSILSDTHIINQVLNRKDGGTTSLLGRPQVQRFVDRNAKTLSKLSDLLMFFLGSDVLRANSAFGFDGVFVMYWDGGILDHERIYDCFGRVFRIQDDGYGNGYPMYEGGLIDSPDAWESWANPDTSDFAKRGTRIYRILKKLYGKKIAVIPFVGPGLWENSWQPFGFSRFAVLMSKEPDFLRKIASYYTEISVACVEAYAREGARVIAFGDDLAYKSGPMVSPDTLNEFYGEGYKKITSTAHRYGAKIIIHCCGNTKSLLGHFIEWGFDGAHAFEPTAGNSLAEARNIVGDKLCLVGNIDVSKTLVDAPKNEVYEAVRQAIEESEGGGLILAPAHTHPGVSAERVRWMIEAAEGWRG